MKKYSVILEGKNFSLTFNGVTELYGFYTTRRVKAINEHEAELVAVKTIKNDPELLGVINKSSNSSPRIYLERMHSLKWWNKLGGKGYTFYKMETNDL